MNELKVGDWIINTTHSKPKPMIVTQAMIDDKSPHNHGPHLELWQPKEGEWCWFYNGRDYRTAQFGKHISNDADTSDIPLYEYFTLYNNRNYSTYCEPFIGTLPSFIKEIK